MTKPTHEEEIREIWRLFRATEARFEDMGKRFAETDKLFEEVGKRFAETDRRFAETDARLDKLFAATDRRFAETDRRFAETDRRFAETDARLDKLFAATNKQIQKTSESFDNLYGMFAGQWGKMMEALVEPSAIQIFQERGIQVNYVYQRIKARRNGRHMELDIVLEDDDVVVIVEVKSTLRVQDVRDFLETLEELLVYFPRYKDHTIYGGVAGLDIVEDADRFAYRHGLFVLCVVGEGLVKILNDVSFEPKDFSCE